MSNSCPLKTYKPPRGEAAASQLLLLEALDTELKSSGKKLSSWSKQSNKGVRVIQNEQYEVTVQTSSNTNQAFKTICREVLKKKPEIKRTYNTVDKMIEALLSYSKTQARKDHRLSQGSFENYSILVNYGKAPVQPPHVHQEKTNYRIGVVLTDDTAPTIIYKQRHSIRTVDDLNQHAWRDLPDDVKELLQGNDDTKALLHNFGNVLDYGKPLTKSKTKLPAGAVFSFPGNIVQAAPEAETFSAVLFFTTGEKEDTGSLHNTQHNKTSLWCDLIRNIWLDASTNMKLQMLSKLHESIEGCKLKCAPQGLLLGTVLTKFVDMLCKKEYTGSVQSALERFERETPYLDVRHDLCGQVLSVPQLMAKSGKDRTRPVCIYRSSNKKRRSNVILYYPSFDGMEEKYQGENKRFSIQLNNDQELFNGRNGTLQSRPNLKFSIRNDIRINANNDTMNDIARWTIGTNVLNNSGNTDRKGKVEDINIQDGNPSYVIKYDDSDGTENVEESREMDSMVVAAYNNLPFVRTAIREAELCSNDQKILRDAHDKPRGIYTSVPEEFLKFLAKYQEDSRSKLTGVSNGTKKKLFHHRFEFEGLNPKGKARPINYYKAAAKLGFNIHAMDAQLRQIVKDALRQIDACTEAQEIEYYISVLYSVKTALQDPHIDYSWKTIDPSHTHFKSYSGFNKDNFATGVPYISLFGTTEAGMTVQVFPHRLNHTIPLTEMPKEHGVLIHIPYGKMLLLRADVVHAGGFKTAKSGNPRGDMYIHKRGRGAVPFNNKLTNTYDIYTKEYGRIDLFDYYKNSPACYDSKFYV